MPAEGEIVRVIRADVLGMCFGVRDALAVIEGISEPRAVTIHGQLVHNEIVQSRLESRGFVLRAERERAQSVPDTHSVLITAHGISDRERQRLESAGKRLIDTTCPLVTRVHRAARDLQSQGYHVLVIGRRGHVEVNGITEDLDNCDVIESVEQVLVYKYARLGIICQTTVTDERAAAIRTVIAERNPTAEIRFVDTVCSPTKERQTALEGLLERVDAVVVVGGRNSNNTRELVARCDQKDKPVVHVQDALELQADWFRNFQSVGLTAGTSTLPETIDRVHQALLCIASAPSFSGESIANE
jgi:4-hydroxy-3-methylbut-2-enyl diphosphate reductase